VLGALDHAALRLLRTYGHGPLAELAVVRFSRLGNHGGLWLAIACLGALLDGSRRPAYLRAIRAAVATLFVNYLIKVAIRRARPLLEDLPPLSPTASSLSYPSAHASTSFAGAGALSQALPGAPLYCAAAAMALSRPYLGIHYPSDVAAGAALGAAMAKLVP
jgi:undecaprenyl-diphosphatase